MKLYYSFCYRSIEDDDIVLRSFIQSFNSDIEVEQLLSQSDDIQSHEFLGVFERNERGHLVEIK
jgi:hypothetical protein